MASYEDIEGNPKVNLLNNNFDDCDDDQDGSGVTPATSIRRKPVVTQEPKKRPGGRHQGQPGPYGYGMPPFGMPGMPPMWGYPPGGGGVYRRRGDRAPAYHSGWADGSDSDEERARDPSKVPGEAAFQAYIMIGMIVIVMAVVGSVKLYELWYGKPDIPENRIEF